MTAAKPDNETGAPLASLNAQTLARIPVVVGWLTEGRSRREVVDCAAVEWGIAPRAADRLIAHARAELVASWQVQRGELTALLLERADLVFRLAVAQNNSGAAVAALGFMAKTARLG